MGGSFSGYLDPGGALGEPGNGENIGLSGKIPFCDDEKFQVKINSPELLTDFVNNEIM